VQDPESYLGERRIAMSGFLDPQRPAPLDPELRSRIGFDVFFFADRESKERFDREWPSFVERLTDPVSWARFEPGSDSPQLTWGGRRYVFASEENRQAFESDPDGYADAKGRMRGMAPTS